MLSKYGSTNAAYVEDFQEKKRETNIRRYGCSNPFQNSEIQQKQHITMENIYGVPYSMQCESIKQKSVDTSMEHYGVPYPMMNDGVRNKAMRTNILKYGNEFSIASDFVQDKIRETCRIKYGVEYPLQNKDILEETYATMRKNGNNYVLTSTEQCKLAARLGFELNFKIGGYYADMVSHKNSIVCEYDGGGHDLTVKLGQQTEIQFYLRERYRERFMYYSGYKTIRIINRKDINLDNVDIERFISDGINFLKTTSYIVYCYDIDKKEITYR